jgi:4-amino-4-deoxy-L-arabinose transferase-like glycosyltransferase
MNYQPLCDVLSQKQAGALESDRLKPIALVFLCIFVLGAAVRIVDVWSPLDSTSWRDADVASIARNYYREGMNLFYPRIDWRGDGPGFAEMEFPIYPWSIAVLYKLLGYHETFGRLLSYTFSLIAMAVFFLLARHLLPPAGAITAATFFALSPLAISTSTSLQPDGLMFLFYILASYAFLRWLDDAGPKYYILALAATAFAILAKAPAAHIGLLFAVLLLKKKGLVALRQTRVWIFAVLSLLPAALWYTHAYTLWVTYGNSLGLSNEYHWAGWDFFTNPDFIQGITRSEILYVWMPTGLGVVAYGLFRRRSDKAARFSLYWLTAILVFYIVAARTTGDDWAVYYHVFSVPPAALLFGLGADAIWNARVRPSFLTLFLPIAAGVFIASSGIIHTSKLILSSLVLGPLVFALMVLFRHSAEGHVSKSQVSRNVFGTALITCLVVVLMCATLLFQARSLLWGIQSRKSDPLYTCARGFSQDIPPGTLIVASGGACKDPTGYPVAYNAAYMFYWLDCKGFNVCYEQQSIQELRTLALRGARYFIAEKAALREKPGFATELRATFPLVRECGAALLYELTPMSARRPNQNTPSSSQANPPDGPVRLTHLVR